MKEAQKYQLDELKQARENGLFDARMMFVADSHGEAAGVDVFSWVNPDIDSLDRMLASLKNRAIWVATIDQVNQLWKLKGKGMDVVETLIVYDSPNLFDEKWKNAFRNAVCVEGANHALSLLDAFRSEGQTLIWTLPQDNWRKTKTELELEIETWK